MKQKKEVIYTDFRAEKFLSKFIPVSKNQLVSSIKKIKLSPPLVLKIISPQALHKSDIGGVKIVKTQIEIGPAFDELIKISKRKKLRLEGIMVQEFIEGEKIILGIKKDPVFNHTILMGLGGIFTEVLDDISIRKCPITLEDAEEMIGELKAAKIFKGFRGKNLNVKVLKETMVKLSKIPLKYKSISELDINPFILNEKQGKVVDARIVFEK